MMDKTHGTPYAVEMVGVTKEFPGIRANDNVTLRLRRGEIHALLGENGAGKSTLMSILFGLYQPDAGKILINGEEKTIANPNDANALGIGMVHQHFKLVHNFTVLENIVLGSETTRGGTLRMREARRQVVALSERYKLHVEPDALISNTTVGMQQRVEILKMLYRDNNVLIFDEPTAVLTPQEIAELMNIMQTLAAEGKSILFITHKLAEIKQVSQTCTVLRKGQLVGSVPTSDASIEQLSEMMVGRKVDLNLDKAPATPTNAPILTVSRLTVKGGKSGKNAVSNVSFDVRGGEIVCVAGIDGNGQSELVYALTGLLPTASGSVSICGKDITRASIRERNLTGLSHIPEDRHKHGLVLDYNLAYNLALKGYFRSPMQRRGFLSFASISMNAERLIDDFDVRAGEGGRTPARSLSGGNQQKAIIAREVTQEPNILIAVQPTRGLDIGAIDYIHRRIIKTRDSGKAVLLVSFELDEVLNLADRILVMYEGEIVANLMASEATASLLGLYMSGSRRDAAV